MNHFLTKTLLACGVVFSMSGAASASIVFFGSDIDLGSGWRTGTVVKSDVDGDNVLGTDGFRYVRTGTNPDFQELNPSYAVMDLTDLNFGGNASYAQIDNPFTTPGATPDLQSSGTFNPGGGAVGAGEGELISFGTVDFNRAAMVDEVVRVGLMVDNLDNSIFNSHMLQISGLGGLAASSAIVSTTAETDTDNLIPDWYYFDVRNFAAGDQVEVFATRSDGNPAGTSLPATIGAFSFDSAIVAVPEPSSAALLGLMGLVAFSRRRK